uniref:Uncharacterized protein n=1 Tax=Knipowitschia caucasica TaxID=637954 RepID=A0AAV2JRZ1_KNICA
MSFMFTPPAAERFCKIRAYSITTPNNGTGSNDFCLFHNLFEESGLIKDPGYREITNEKMCPSRATAKCISNESQLPVVR